MTEPSTTRVPVVTNWHTDPPIVRYACPACGAAREIPVNRWERGGYKKCLACREVYRLPIPTTDDESGAP